MKNRFGVAMTLVSCLQGCAGAEPESTENVATENVGESKHEIVRPDRTGGPDSSVAVVGLTANGRHRYCSGVVVAPRVVITVAHCMAAVAAGDSVERLIVYYGDSVVGDENQFDQDDDPSKPWAVAESWTLHPDYVADLHFPDLAIIYTKRELPLAPAPLSRTSLKKNDIGKQLQVSGWGATSAALTPDGTRNVGIGVQRTAKVPFRGSPTVADFVPADPNNGLFDPTIRARLAKFDGRAPESNSCFGDSGAPYFVDRGGCQEVVAVNFFTGLSCEGYSMATRVEPFLDYFDDAIEKGGALPVKPTLQCVDQAADGSYTAFFGYDNENAVSIDVPYGPNNQLRQDSSGVRPTHFLPGKHAWEFFINFGRRDRVEYELQSEEGCGADSRSVVAKASSPRCSTKSAEASAAKYCQALSTGCGISFVDCLVDVTGSITYPSQGADRCLDPWVNLYRCMAALPPAVLCNFDNPPPFCVQESAALDACVP